VRALALAVVVAAVLPASAGAAEYAPVDVPGPAVTIPTAKLQAALTCGKGLDGAKRAPVLLLHGTGATVEENWKWNYEPALDSLGIPWCALQSPERGQGDVQLNGEYALWAIREMYRRAGRRVSVIGHSQGGMLPRWPLRFWPDTRRMVDDVIGFAASNHGTTQARATCTGGCSPSSWQQTDGSAFLTALNSRAETFAGVSYTNVYTHTDEIVQPNANDQGSSSLHTGAGRITNVAIQDVCALAVSEHFLIGIADPVAFALARDALDHDGPASVARVAGRGCAQDPIPALQPVGLVNAIVGFTTGGGGAGPVPAEPALRCYTTATCPASQRPRLILTVAPGRAVAGRLTRLRVRVRVRVNGKLQPVRRALVKVGSRKARTAASGRATLRVRFRTSGSRRVTASAKGYTTDRAVVRVRRARR
jgi:hypothetical protein